MLSNILDAVSPPVACAFGGFSISSILAFLLPKGKVRGTWSRMSRKLPNPNKTVDKLAEKQEKKNKQRRLKSLKCACSCEMANVSYCLSGFGPSRSLDILELSWIFGGRAGFSFKCACAFMSPAEQRVTKTTASSSRESPNHPLAGLLAVFESEVCFSPREKPHSL